MRRKMVSGFLLAVWLVLLGAECFEAPPAAPKRLTLTEILMLAEPSLETSDVAGTAKAKAVGVVVASEGTNFCSSPVPGISARRVVEEPLSLKKPPRIYKLHRVFLI